MNGSTATASNTPKRILVVDDTPIVTETIQGMLMQFGHQVETAQGGEDALAKFKPRKYDLVVTDYSMPKMNGIELAQAIKQKAARQLVLLITGFPFSVAANDSPKLPVDFVMLKPFCSTEFERALAVLFPVGAPAP
ncbi:MAG: FixL-related histidine kinase [Pedosphaera sp.]|nr:FixL-related histidine kinase [Pedosphaera sp.]